MNSLLLCTVLALGFEEYDPNVPITIHECSKYDKGVSVREFNDYFVTHFHVLVSRCPTHQLYAKLRCLRTSAEHPSYHVETKQVTTTGNNQEWAFWFKAPKFTSDQATITYQIEVGYYDDTRLNEFVVTDFFVWKMLNGQMVVKSNGENLHAVFTKRLQDEEGGFRIRSAQETGKTRPGISYGIDNNLDTFIEGESTARLVD